MDTRPIGVFDSGLGGLTCVKQLHSILPNEDIIYLGDTGRVPYGTRSEKTLIEYTKQDIDFLLKQNVKLIVVACGTVSSVVLPKIKDDVDIPIVGVVDCSAKAAVQSTDTGKIGVLGTPATIKSHSYSNKMLEINPNLSVTGVACPLFVPLVENGYIDAENKITTLIAQQYLAKLPPDVDTVILGCTHYPLIKGCLSRLMPNVNFIDSGKEVAMLTKSLLLQNNLEAEDKIGSTHFYVTDSVESFISVGSVFLNEKITGNVERIDLV